MDYENFLTQLYTPLRTIELLVDTIDYKSNEDWNFYNIKETREDVKELFALCFAIKIIAEYLLKERQERVKELTI